VGDLLRAQACVQHTLQFVRLKLVMLYTISTGSCGSDAGGGGRSQRDLWTIHYPFLDLCRGLASFAHPPFPGIPLVYREPELATISDREKGRLPHVALQICSEDGRSACAV